MVTFRLICWPGDRLLDDTLQVVLGTFSRPYLPHVGMEFNISEVDVNLRVDLVHDELETGNLTVYVVPQVIDEEERKLAWDIIKFRAAIEPKAGEK